MIVRRFIPVLLASALAASCNEEAPPKAPPLPPASASAVAPPVARTPPPSPYKGIARDDFNRAAVRLNLPLFWAVDKNSDGTLDPGEVKSLLFYPTEGRWVQNGVFTQDFADAFARIQAALAAPAASASTPDAARRKLVAGDLDQGLATLVATDLRGASEEEKRFVRHMLTVAELTDDLYATQRGIKSLAKQVPADDPASQALFRRNWGPRCIAPKTGSDLGCSAIPGAPKTPVDVYPSTLQTDAKFCDKVEKLPNAKALLTPFVAVRPSNGGGFDPVPYTEAYHDAMVAISNELRAAADGISSPSEAALKAYLGAASDSFRSNDWLPSDEAWSKMSVTNSKWYVRAAPDETYWEPCSHKAGFHLAFARVNQGSVAWQEKLLPVQGDMEAALATHIGPPYKARTVTFHLPDFVDIVFVAGDDRFPLGGTLGQSLPNWGKVAAEGRGRTLAMSNLYQDPDSRRIRRSQAESLLDTASMSAYPETPDAGLFSTILHEATHNLGPAHEYAFRGKTDVQAFGGQTASMLEELKAQTGALYFVDFTKNKGLITPEFALEAYADSVVWALGHISRGMNSEDLAERAYSRLSAIQVGFLLDEGALSFDPNGTAANGTDKGVFTLHYDKFPAAADKMMKVVGQIKATGDRAGAEALVKKYVEGTVVPHKLIGERELRYPRQSFVYAIDM